MGVKEIVAGKKARKEAKEKEDLTVSVAVSTGIQVVRQSLLTDHFKSYVITFLITPPKQ